MADTQAVPPEERDRWLARLEEAAERLSRGEPIALEAPPMGGGGGRYERGLIARLPAIAEWVNELEVPARRRAGWVCGILFGAMRRDLARFGEHSEGLIALSDEAELEEYLYGNAGCVGAYWAAELGATSGRFAALDLQSLDRAGIRLGHALQRVNVLRDLAGDLRRGRCYLPEDQVTACGLELRDLYSTAVAPRLRPLVERHIATALQDLAEGMEFFHVLPRRWIRSRAAAALPAVLARRTLDRIAAQPERLLDPQGTVKVPRSEVKRILARLLVTPPSDRALQRMVVGHSP